jgi:hypothetical protein
VPWDLAESQRIAGKCWPKVAGFSRNQASNFNTAMLDAPSIVRLLLVLTLQGADAWRLPVPGRQRSWTMGHRRSRPRMGTDWRPENLDPLGKAMGQAFGVSQFERTHELWLDLRTSENTFAQM